MGLSTLHHLAPACVRHLIPAATAGNTFNLYSSIISGQSSLAYVWVDFKAILGHFIGICRQLRRPARIYQVLKFAHHVVKQLSGTAIIEQLYVVHSAVHYLFMHSMMVKRWPPGVFYATIERATHTHTHTQLSSHIDRRYRQHKHTHTHIPIARNNYAANRLFIVPWEIVSIWGGNICLWLANSDLMCSCNRIAYSNR